MMKKETKLSEHTSLFDIGHKNQDITIRLQICPKKLHYAFEKWIIEPSGCLKDLPSTYN